MTDLDVIMLFIMLASIGGVGFICGRVWEQCRQTDRELDEWARQDRARLDTEGQR